MSFLFPARRYASEGHKHQSYTQHSVSIQYFCREPSSTSRSRTISGVAQSSSFTGLGGGHGGGRGCTFSQLIYLHRVLESRRKSRGEVCNVATPESSSGSEPNSPLLVPVDLQCTASIPIFRFPSPRGWLQVCSLSDYQGPLDGNSTDQWGRTQRLRDVERSRTTH